MVGVCFRRNYAVSPWNFDKQLKNGKLIRIGKIAISHLIRIGGSQPPNVSWVKSAPEKEFLVKNVKLRWNERSEEQVGLSPDDTKEEIEATSAKRKQDDN